MLISTCVIGLIFILFILLAKTKPYVHIYVHRPQTLDELRQITWQVYSLAVSNIPAVAEINTAEACATPPALVSIQPPPSLPSMFISQIPSVGAFLTLCMLGNLSTFCGVSSGSKLFAKAFKIRFQH
ncbi:hypothetical protein DPMN_003911 [Dreissena polymorpha]|uniref:Uncharacterized protein n=1 Tax=Dreissena polymorpha TaxID=45954 RepID=A0A9D4MQL2_DREPO|nr:hypothetical protein DPMN_003900 [Dreissena polymorpha]KAH3879999.1 hypothetical protein DPMN_003911 [Dreissena polymorpha]